MALNGHQLTSLIKHYYDFHTQKNAYKISCLGPPPKQGKARA